MRSRMALGATTVGLLLVSVAPARTASLTLTPHGIGRIAVGMTVTQAQDASGRDLRSLGDSGGGPGCRFWSISGLHAAAMVINGRIVRIDLYRGSPVRTLGALRRGDTEADVRRAFGARVKESPHAYTPGGSYLTVDYRTGPYAGRGIRFATNERGVVQEIYAGRRGAIRYVEGCA